MGISFDSTSRLLVMHKVDSTFSMTDIAFWKKGRCTTANQQCLCWYWGPSKQLVSFKQWALFFFYSRSTI